MSPRINVRVLAFLAASVLSLILLISIGSQHRELEQLRKRRQEQRPGSATQATTDRPDNSFSHPDPMNAVFPSPVATPRDLIALRSRATELMRRRRELDSVREENRSLRENLEAQRTSDASLPSLPKDYIRVGTAQWAGLRTPAATLQSFLWSIEHRDWNRLLETMAPEQAEALRKSNPDPDSFFQEAARIPGMRITREEKMPDGTRKVYVEIAPGEEIPSPFHFKQFDGNWRTDSFF